MQVMIIENSRAGRKECVEEEKQHGRRVALAASVGVGWRWCWWTARPSREKLCSAFTQRQTAIFSQPGRATRKGKGCWPVGSLHASGFFLLLRDLHKKCVTTSYSTQLHSDSQSAWRIYTLQTVFKSAHRETNVFHNLLPYNGTCF